MMFVFFLAAFTIPMHFIFDDLATGLGVGAMSALWGAPGFGAMAAAGLWDLRNRDENSN